MDMIRSPCFSCPDRHRDKRRDSVCQNCKIRVLYDNSIRENVGVNSNAKSIILPPIFSFTSGPMGNDFTKTLIEYEGKGGAIKY